MLDAACRQLCRVAGRRPAEVRIAVNLSALQLRDAQLADKVAAALAVCGLDGAALELEVTESALMSDPPQTAGTLARLRALGVQLAIDDFGTGYSSLAYLKQFPIDRLKIDRSFVRDLASDPNDAAIARTIITLAHSLGLRVIAEGVETPAQLGFLRGHGCDEAGAICTRRRSVRNRLPGARGRPDPAGRGTGTDAGRPDAVHRQASSFSPRPARERGKTMRLRVIGLVVRGGRSAVAFLVQHDEREPAKPITKPKGTSVTSVMPVSA